MTEGKLIKQRSEKAREKMKIVIELSDEIYKDIKEENGIYGINNGLSARITGKVVGAIQSGTLLPKRHGRIVDENKITKCEQIGLIIKDGNITRCLQTDAPTIVPAASR